MTTDESATKDSERAENPPAKESSNRSHKPNRVLLVPYPKFVFMYPTLIVSAITALVLYIGGHHNIDPENNALPVIMTAVFLVVFVANMFIIVFDFPRATSLTLVFIVTSLALGAWILALAQPDLVPAATKFIAKLRPAANAAFFACFAIAMLIMYIAVFITTRFNYWELRNNELLHHHGLLSDLKRYPAPNLRVDKEINDVFEFILLGAGRLILHPSTEKRSIVLDNVLFVGDKERKLTQMLGSIKVQIRGDSGIEQLG